MENKSLPETFKAVISSRDGTRGSFQDVKMEPLKENEILIKVAYGTLNPSDFGTLDGFYPVYPGDQAIPKFTKCRVGIEGSGVVVASGENCKYKLENGTKVSFLQLGGWSEYVTVPSDRVVKLNENVSLKNGAPTGNAITCLFMHKLAIDNGHKAVVQNAANSALGRMCIRYFKKMGTPLINIVRNDKYIEELKKEGAEYVINQEKDDFEEKLQELTKKLNATLAFDVISGEMTGRILWAMPCFSELYILGAFSQKPIMAGIEDILFQDKSIKGFFVTKFINNATPEERQEICKKVQELLPDVFKSNVAGVFDLEKYNDALNAYKKLSSEGKILLHANKDLE